jgi:nitroreductase
MEFKDVIEARRAYRSLLPDPIPISHIEDMVDCARIMCSCFNKQPWRFIVSLSEPTLQNLKKNALSAGNSWAYDASAIIAVTSAEDLDCIIKDRKYYAFDTGLATAALILRATDLGWVAHPIAGYNPDTVKEILNIPEKYQVITLIIIGKKAKTMNPIVESDDFKRNAELNRPERLEREKILFYDTFKEII